MGVNFFPSRWPIMCAVMNQVSDLHLALAVHEAGAMPSFMVCGNNRIDRIRSGLDEFVKCTGHANLVLNLEYKDLIDANIMKLIKQYKVSHVELFGSLDTKGMTTQQEFEHIMSDPLYQHGLKFIQATTKTMIRVLTPTDKRSKVSAYALKGSDSAGFTGKLTVLDLFKLQKQLTPDVNLVPYGGVGTPQQVAQYMQQGAAGVAVGTLFAASKESCLDESVKHKMVLANADSLVKFTTSQQALVLGDTTVVQEDRTPNRQISLASGIAGQGGLIYAGSAIDHVREIRSVKEIVEYLVEELK